MTLELIAEQLWNRGWQSDLRYTPDVQPPWLAVLWQRDPPCRDFHSGRGDSALVALERARAELDREQPA